MIAILLLGAWLLFADTVHPPVAVAVLVAFAIGLLGPLLDDVTLGRRVR